MYRNSIHFFFVILFFITSYVVTAQNSLYHISQQILYSNDSLIGASNAVIYKGEVHFVVAQNPKGNFPGYSDPNSKWNTLSLRNESGKVIDYESSSVATTPDMTDLQVTPDSNLAFVFREPTGNTYGFRMMYSEWNQSTFTLTDTIFQNNNWGTWARICYNENKQPLISSFSFAGYALLLHAKMPTWQTYNLTNNGNDVIQLSSVYNNQKLLISGRHGLLKTIRLYTVDFQTSLVSNEVIDSGAFHNCDLKIHNNIVYSLYSSNKYLYLANNATGSWVTDSIFKMDTVYHRASLFFKTDGTPVIACQNNDTLSVIEKQNNGWNIIYSHENLIKGNTLSGRNPTLLYKKNLLHVFFADAKNVYLVNLENSKNENINLQSGLSAYYPLDSNANDYSGNSLNGTLQNETSFKKSVIGDGVEVVGACNNPSYCIENDGGHVLLPYLDFNSKPSFTISLWVYDKGALSDGEGFIFYGDHASQSVGIGYYGNIQFAVGNKAVTIPYNSQNLNHWILYTLTINNGKVQAYKNGDIVGYDSLFTVALSQTTAALGRHWWNAGGSTSTRMNGIFDDVRIYDRNLNEAEIDSLYRYGIDQYVLQNDFTKPQLTISVLSTDTVFRYGDTLKIIVHTNEAIANTSSMKIIGSGALFLDSTLTRISDTVFEFVYVISNIGGVANLKVYNASDRAGNKIDTIACFKNGITIIPIRLGDVDDNTKIQAYDAALTLQKTIGNSALQWQPWRVATANVDNTSKTSPNNITANDAALILKYSVDSLHIFPASKLKTYSSAVSITIENNNLVFRAIDSLLALNISIPDGNKYLGTPKAGNDSIMLSYSITNTNYSAGIATAFVPEPNTELIRIPILEIGKSITLLMLIDTMAVSETITLTNVDEYISNSIRIYPNPVKDVLYFKNIIYQKEFHYEIYNTLGVLVEHGVCKNNSIITKNFPIGMYLIYCNIGNSRKSFLFVRE